MIALLAVGCGSDAGDDEPAGGGGAGSTEGRPGPATEVTITFWPEGKGGPSREAALTCDPVGGTHPDPERACALLAGDPGALEPVPPDAVCTMIFGGPEEAEIAGVVNGEEVHATFSRSNGCEVDRWDRLAGVLQLGD
ncbi:MAG: SSI family serine proteinase inhibitor [Gaiellaceae bacterium]